MDLKQLEAFVSVISEGSFSKAAKKLFLTQPTISAHIGALERELGRQLILRTPKEALPTEAGSELYTYAVQMLALRDRAVTRLSGTGHAMSGVVTVAASTIPHQYVLPGMMTAFRSRHPNITFNLLRYDSAGVVEAVSLGKAEVGMTGAVIGNPHCSYHPFLEDELVIVTPNTEPYLSMGTKAFSLEELQKLPFIIREPGSGTRQETEAFLAARGLHINDLNIIAQIDDPDAIKHAIGQGLGISIMSRLSASDHERFGMVRTFSPAGEAILRRLYLVRQREVVLSPAAEAFLAFALEHDPAHPSV